MSKRQQTGFTLVETVVTIGIIAMLAGILTPVVARYISDARITRATTEAQTIADAILRFNKDTGKWPIFQTGASPITTSTAIWQILSGPGNDPACTGCTATWLDPSRGSLSDILELNKPHPTNPGTAYPTSGKFAWRGPYITNIQSDPWGNAYFVNSGSLAFGVSEAGFVLSAGPDGIIQTDDTQSIASGGSAVVISGDDIVARIR